MIRRAAAILTLSGALAAAQTSPAAQAARTWRQAHENAVLSEFMTFLALPNLARDNQGIRKNAAAVSAMFEKRGVKTQYLEVPGAPPVVYGEIPAANATRTLIFYAHYDGQPLDLKEWATPPWEPVLRDGRIWARSSSDDKAPFAAIATALDALAAAKIPLRQNVKFVFEGEEEAGSPHLGQIISRYRDLLKSDGWLICDGPVHQSRRQQIVFGARGIAELAITLYGPNHELHSGHYGNWAPNPAMALARLLASMKDNDGRVLIDHFYDGIAPLSDTEKRAIAEAPEIDRDLMRELWLGRTEGGGKKLIELINLPSLNVRGMASSRVGDKASNVVPSTATATLDMRLVKGIGPATAFARARDHIRKQGYTIVDQEPDAETRMKFPRLALLVEDPASYPASRTSMDLPISQLVLRTAESARGPIVRLPTMGGSVPLYLIEDILHSPTITVPIANHDNNQHSFNENIRVQNLWDGIELMAALLAM
jgi:acetylornithine deacetylase/succinyl-diaminopimelate desuccinylase-like protein